MDYHQERQEDLKILFEYLTNYEFYDEGYLDLEAFCRILSMCFDADMALEGSAHPNDVYNLCLDLIKPYLKEDWHLRILPIDRYADANPRFHYDKVTLVHIAALIHIWEWWIYYIGNSLMNIPRPRESVSYVYWVNREWSFVMIFMECFQKATHKIIKMVSRESIGSNGYCLLEALNLTKLMNITYDEAAKLLTSRNKSLNEALDRIKKSIEDGYYLEALALQENVMSACLYDFLSAKKKVVNGSSFYKLLETFNNNYLGVITLDGTFFEKLDIWRKSRNSAIHGFIKCRVKSPQKTSLEFDTSNKVSATEGLELTQTLLEWFMNETTEFLESRLPISDSETQMH